MSKKNEGRPMADPQYLPPETNKTAPAAQDRPPHNTQDLQRWADLPTATAPQAYEVTPPEGPAHKVTVEKGKRRVLAALMHGPVYCASRVRISHYVNVLRDENGLTIETERYSSETVSGGRTYGVYVLRDKVRPVCEVAA